MESPHPPAPAQDTAGLVLVDALPAEGAGSQSALGQVRRLRGVGGEGVGLDARMGGGECELRGERDKERERERERER